MGRPVGIAFAISSNSISDAIKANVDGREKIVLEINLADLTKQEREKVLNHLNYKACVEGVVATSRADDISDECGKPN